MFPAPTVPCTVRLSTSTCRPLRCCRVDLFNLLDKQDFLGWSLGPRDALSKVYIFLSKPLKGEGSSRFPPRASSTIVVIRQVNCIIVRGPLGVSTLLGVKSVRVLKLFSKAPLLSKSIHMLKQKEYHFSPHASPSKKKKILQ